MRGRREIMWWREHGKGEGKREGGEASEEKEEN